MTEVSTMSYEFHEWLSECPVEWIRLKNDEHGVSTYMFIETTDYDEEEE